MTTLRYVSPLAFGFSATRSTAATAYGGLAATTDRKTSQHYKGYYDGKSRFRSACLIA